MYAVILSLKIYIFFVADGEDAYVDDIMQEFKTAKRFVLNQFFRSTKKNPHGLQQEQNVYYQVGTIRNFKVRYCKMFPTTILSNE